jgi:type VI secretion system protein ImpF
LSTSGIDLVQLQSRVRQAILDHEPRILSETLAVEVVVSNTQLDHHNLIGFRISGQLWAQPVPMELLLHTDIDLETGRVAVRELDR